MKFYATCPAGLESALGLELEELKCARVRPLTGQVAFEGPLKDAYTVLMWSRLASSVVAVIAQFACEGPDGLYAGAAEVDWTEHMSPAATFAVQTNGTMAGISNSMYASQLVKDAIVDEMLKRLGTRPNVDTAQPDVRIRLRLREGHASLGIDLSGEPLFKRGYEQVKRIAKIGALRPDYAAAMLRQADFGQVLSGPEPTLAVAFAGAGTLACEAAAMAGDSAPGRLRVRWGFNGWLGHSQRTWDNVKKAAEKRFQASEGRAFNLVISDTRPGFASSCRQMLRSAGLRVEPVVVDPRDVGVVAKELTGNTLVAVDLSWLYSDEAAREAEALSFVTNFAAELPEGTPAATLARDNALEALFCSEPEVVDEVMMGREPVIMACYDDARISDPLTVTLDDGSEVAVLVAATDQFAARLQKVAKQKAEWAAAEDVSCYRVYDQDLPDYNVALDLYHGAPQTPGTWLVAAEYAAPKEIDPEIARRRLIDVLTVAPRVLGVRSYDVALRVRSHGKGGVQYAAPADISRSIKQGKDRALERKQRGRGTGKPRIRRVLGAELAPGAKLVEEGGLIFEVNFEDHLDTGLFLDNREVRAEIREMAKRMSGAKRFLNLFAYTGSGTVYAADGGAAFTTTVDLSWNYIDWAKRNMERNGFGNPRPSEEDPEPLQPHEYVKADVIAWIAEQRKTRNRWDLVFCDPPTFSNSTDMKQSSFEVQRDHAELLIGISRLLTAEGVCLFSCNLRTFKPDVEKLERAGVVIEDITAQMTAHDFERNAKAHHVYLVKRAPMTDEKRAEIEARKARGDHGYTQAPDSVRKRGGRPGGRPGQGRGAGRPGSPNGRPGGNGGRPGGGRERGHGGAGRPGGHGGGGRPGGQAAQNRKGQGYRSEQRKRNGR